MDIALQGGEHPETTVHIKGGREQAMSISEDQGASLRIRDRAIICRRHIVRCSACMVGGVILPQD